MESHEQRRAPLPVVTVQRARCPNAICRSVDIVKRRSLGEQGDGSLMRYVRCRTCGQHFTLWLE